MRKAQPLQTRYRSRRYQKPTQSNQTLQQYLTYKSELAISLLLIYNIHSHMPYQPLSLDNTHSIPPHHTTTTTFKMKLSTILPTLSLLGLTSAKAPKDHYIANTPGCYGECYLAGVQQCHGTSALPTLHSTSSFPPCMKTLLT
jgi:hypothetical protein